MLRSVCESVSKVNGAVVQLDARPSSLLVSTPSASFVVNLTSKEIVQVRDDESS